MGLVVYQPLLSPPPDLPSYGVASPRVMPHAVRKQFSLLGPVVGIHGHRTSECLGGIGWFLPATVLMAQPPLPDPAHLTTHRPRSPELLQCTCPPPVPPRRTWQT